MSKRNRGGSIFSIFLNVILILFLVGYFFVPFADNSVLSKIYKPFCSIQKLYQGTDYVPAWCSIEKTQPAANNNQNTNANSNVNLNTNTNASVGIANPASVKCKEDGGDLEIIKSATGEWGLCTFNDGSICEEWDYFRGDCNPGECFKECQAIDTSMEGWYNTCTRGLIELAECGQKEIPSVTPPSSDEGTATAEKSIKVTSPIADEQLSSPFKVEGQAIVYQDKVYIRIKNTNGNVLIEENTLAKHQSGTEWGDFSISINYEFNLTKEGFVEVYSLDQDGQEQNLVSIPVKF